MVVGAGANLKARSLCVASVSDPGPFDQILIGLLHES